jgi:hypothetical protein
MLNRGISWLAGHEEFSVSRWVPMVYVLVMALNVVLIVDLVSTITASTTYNTMVVKDLEACYMHQIK